MKLSLAELQAAARAEAFALPIEQIDPATADYFENDTDWPYFERLRRDDPVHHAHSPLFGPYWSVSTYKPIVEAESLLLRDAPLAPLYFNTRTWLMSPRVRGWSEDPLWTRHYTGVHLVP